MSSDLQEEHSNVNEKELDDETKEKLRGDAIGNTMYSQRFVLKTLLKFSDLQWCEELEDDLCFLWDMTVEKDVCDFLIDHSFPSIACTAIAMYSENRFLEIVIGILANILSVNREVELKKEEIYVVINELDTDDHLILIQILRFLKALTYNTTLCNQQFTISDDFVKKIVFILNYSINKDLLMKCLEVLAQLTCSLHFGVKFFNSIVMDSTLTAYKTLMYTDDSEFDMETQEKQLTVQYFFEIVKNQVNFKKEMKECHTKIIFQEIRKLLTHVSVEQNIIPITERVDFFLSVVLYIFENLNIGYIGEVMINVCKIIFILKSHNIVSDSYDTSVELLCYLICKGKLSNIYNDLDTLPLLTVKECIKSVPLENEKYMFNYLDNYENIKLRYLENKRIS